jgi:L-amino acid N-acyltransferase YncA
MPPTIRDATAADLPAILEIVNHEILHNTADYRYDEQKLGDITAWFEDRKAKSYPVIVAVSEEDGQVAGYASYSQFRERIGFRFTMEHSIYVKSGLTGKGVGSVLLKELISRSKGQGHHAMIACIDAANQGSVAFHAKFGFEHTGTMKQIGYKFDRCLDMTIMQLTMDRETI